MGPKISPVGRLNERSVTLITTRIDKETAIIECQRKQGSEFILANQATGSKEAEFGGVDWRSGGRGLAGM